MKKEYPLTLLDFALNYKITELELKLKSKRNVLSKPGDATTSITLPTLPANRSNSFSNDVISITEEFSRDIEIIEELPEETELAEELPEEMNFFFEESKSFQVRAVINGENHFFEVIGDHDNFNSADAFTVVINHLDSSVCDAIELCIDWYGLESNENFEKVISQDNVTIL